MRLDLPRMQMRHDRAATGQQVAENISTGLMACMVCKYGEHLMQESIAHALVSRWIAATGTVSFCRRP